MLKRAMVCWTFGLVLAAVPAVAQSSACDVNNDGVVNVVDVQLATNMYLQTTPCTANIAGPGVCTPQVVQTVVNAALGSACFLHHATLTWNAGTSISGYNIYRSTTSGGPYTKQNFSLITALTYTDTTAQAGQTYFYVATAVGMTGVESSFSTQVSFTVPTP